ncbi:MAG: methylmalonyl-CoA epimerase [Candidatus Zixiibacteriota bacterium]|nr:MAG: methylmalonyl-CoA epimerase [candidate division Zixibacteria bacterium]
MGAVSHIGIAVENLEEAIELFSEILGCRPESIEDIAEQKVKVAIFRPGGENTTAIELVCPQSESSPVKKYLDKQGPGLHHISIGVEDLAGKLKKLKSNDFRLIDEAPRDGAEGKKIAFVHPSSTAGVLIELEQE